MLKLKTNSYFLKTVLRKYGHGLVENRVSLTRWRHRTSTSCWSNDGVRKENLHFDNQSWEVFCFLCFYQVIETLVKVWENLKKLWKHSPPARVPTAFLVLPNLHLCFYNSSFLDLRVYPCLDNPRQGLEHMKVRNFEANERYRLCYRNKHLPCIFTFQHTHQS